MSLNNDGYCTGNQETIAKISLNETLQTETSSIAISICSEPVEENKQSSFTEMPLSLELLPDDLTSSDSILVNDINSDKTETECTEPSFMISEDSIALGEAHFEPFPEQTSTSVSSCFSRNRELECDDSLDASSRDMNSFPATFKSLEKDDDEDDIFVIASEESSMDSGLGSVDSTYPNSEEENTLSPPTMDKQSSHVHGTQNSSSANLGADEFCDCLTTTSNTDSARPKKRKHDLDESQIAEQNSRVKKRKIDKKVGFQDVTVYYFPRKQSFITVPSQGGSTLGMGLQHVHCQTMTLQEHNEAMKNIHKEKIREHFREQKIENKIQQLKFLNPDLDNGTLSSMAQNAVGKNESSSMASEDDSVLDNFDEFFFLQPISAKKRRKILRASGVERIDGEEKLMNRILRESREMCGCACEMVCMPESCECVLSGIQCQVDREGFPCGCAASQCQNENGRIEFDSDGVRTHLLETMERLSTVQDGSQVEVSDCQTGNELESVASSESECDFLSSDETDQSDEVLGMHQRTHIKFEDAETCVCIKSSDRTVSNNSDYNNPTSGPEKNKSPSFEFLNALGLSKIDLTHFSYGPTTEVSANITSTTLTDILIENSAEIPHSTVVPYEQFSPFMHNDNIHHHSTIESLAQSIPNPTDLPQQATRPMFGTTLAKSCSQDNPTSRDCSVLLDPIATFMTSSYSISSNSETIPCTSK
uniref:cysteine/serine-rich nuclear protein 2-like n=1 Tax=Styela clava TaxID=7725 RepID=UPI001939A356|nr:cysteine/serine-rich nuclear protein 2-like [Styela clava]